MKFLAFILASAISWGGVVLFTWLISLCFGFQFTVLIATGVWLVLLLVWWFLKKATDRRITTIKSSGVKRARCLSSSAEWDRRSRWSPNLTFMYLPSP